MLLQLPVCAFAAIKNIACITDIFLQFRGNFPLSVVGLLRRHGDVAARQYFLGICKDRLPPPFDLSIFCGRETANEWAYLGS